MESRQSTVPRLDHKQAKAVPALLVLQSTGVANKEGNKHMNEILGILVKC